MVAKFDEGNQNATLVSVNEGDVSGGAFTIPFAAIAPFDNKLKRRDLKDMRCDELTEEALLMQMGFPDIESMSDFGQ